MLERLINLTYGVWKWALEETKKKESVFEDSGSKAKKERELHNLLRISNVVD